MAKYTMLFSDWLKSNSLPSIFNEIDGFADLFTLKYAAREIGFETPDLFNLRLNGIANLVIPVYVQRLNEINNIEDIAPNKERTRNFTGGARSANETILPFNTQNGTVPTNKSQSDTYNDNESIIETGFTPDEIIRSKDFLYKKPFNLINNLLNEFEILFMKVY